MRLPGTAAQYIKETNYPKPVVVFIAGAIVTGNVGQHNLRLMRSPLPGCL